MINFTEKLKDDEDNLNEYKRIILISNGSFSIFLATFICVVNAVIIFATARHPLPAVKVIDQIHKAFFYANIMDATLFLPYFGVAELLHGLGISEKKDLFPSYLSSAFLVFAQSKVPVTFIILIERGAAFNSPHFHRRITKNNRIFMVLLTVALFSLLFVGLSFAGMKETVYFSIHIHLFFTAPLLFILVTTFVTYWKLKNRNRIVSSEIPPSMEQLEFHKKRSVRSARRYLIVIASLMIPMFLCILPWYVVTLVKVNANHVYLTNNLRFLWQRFSITLLFLPDVIGPITLTLRFKTYYNSVKSLLRR